MLQSSPLLPTAFAPGAAEDTGAATGDTTAAVLDESFVRIKVDRVVGDVATLKANGLISEKARLQMPAFDVDFDTPANSTLSQLPDVVITDFNSWFINYTTFYSVPQPGSSSGLDPIREVILNRLQYRNFGTHESLVGVLPTNAYTATSGSSVSAALRWFELRRTTGDWQLHQEGTFATGDLDDFEDRPQTEIVGDAAVDEMRTSAFALLCMAAQATHELAHELALGGQVALLAVLDGEQAAAVDGQVEAAVPQVAVLDNGVVGVFYYTFDGFSGDDFPIFTAHLALSDDVDLTGGVIAAQTNTIQSGYVAETGATLLEFATPDETIAAVINGEADAVFADADFLLPKAEESGGELVIVGDPVPLGGGVGMGLRETDGDRVFVSHLFFRFLSLQVQSGQGQRDPGNDQGDADRQCDRQPQTDGVGVHGPGSAFDHAPRGGNFCSLLGHGDQGRLGNRSAKAKCKCENQQPPQVTLAYEVVGHLFADWKQRHLQSTNEQGQAQQHLQQAPQHFPHIRYGLFEHQELKKGDNKNDGNQGKRTFGKRLCGFSHIIPDNP